MQCVNCGIQTNNPKFCSSSCNALYKNLHSHWRKVAGILKSPNKCLQCNKDINYNKKYCSIRCQKNYEYEYRIEQWRQTEYIGKHSLRKYLVETYGYKCSECGIVEWNNKPITLEIEHKDGNSENNKEKNVCLICPNCHSQTSTYKAKNKGNGRHSRRQRYKEGKSF